jgi:hypothetical protein
VVPVPWYEATTRAWFLPFFVDIQTAAMLKKSLKIQPNQRVQKSQEHLIEGTRFLFDIWSNPAQT